jgi:CheY-like chemotaxis protein
MSAQIVLAEDDPALCTVLDFALKEAGYDVRAYASANKAWDAAGSPLKRPTASRSRAMPSFIIKARPFFL